MTLKDAILKSLDELKSPQNYNQIYSYLIEKRYCEIGGETPTMTVNRALGDFIRNGDIRVRRVKKGALFAYYTSKIEQSIDTEILNQETIAISQKINYTTSYEERDLHMLLSSYLKSSAIYTKTIFHEQSNGKDNNQIWTHPDMIGIKFLNLQTKASQNFLKSINRVDTFKMSSYEIKKEINNDSELKKAYFQAVSNSSWANFGYLVAFEYSASLTEELERLNQSFGIGVIELNANPYQSKILFPAKYRDLDFKTIDKLCKINKEFEQFIEQTEKLMTAEERYYKSTEKEFDEFCDKYLKNDPDIEEYCNEKNIPIEQE